MAYLKYLPLVLTVTGTLASALAIPAYVSHHLVLYAVLNVAAHLLHSILPSLFGLGTDNQGS